MAVDPAVKKPRDIRQATHGKYDLCPNMFRYRSESEMETRQTAGKRETGHKTG